MITIAISLIFGVSGTVFMLMLLFAIIAWDSHQSQ